MKSYKILYQEDQHKNFSDYFKKENIDYIEGKINGSFAIQYNPQKLNSLLNEKEFFAKWIEYGIKQAIMTDQKFAFLILNLERIGISFLDCETNDGDNREIICDEDDRVSRELLLDLVSDEYKYILSASFFSKTHRNKIKLTQKGILHFEKSGEEIKTLIDIVNVGNEALNNEKCI